MSEDQDFFFDEDETVEEEIAEKPARKSTAKSSAKPAPRQSAAPAAQSVTVTVAALIGVVALLFGVIIGILIPAGGSTTSPTSSNTGTISAPQLTDEQIQSGELPQGHPDIGSMSGGATATPDATTPAE